MVIAVRSPALVETHLCKYSVEACTQRNLLSGEIDELDVDVDWKKFDTWFETKLSQRLQFKGKNDLGLN